MAFCIGDKLEVPCKLEVVFLDDWAMAVVWPQMNQFGVARRGAATEESSKLEAGVSATGVADAHLPNGSAFMHLTKPEEERRWIHIFLFVTLFCEWSLFLGWRWSSDSDAEREVCADLRHLGFGRLLF